MHIGELTYTVEIHTAAGDFYCVGCRDEEGDPIAYPCPTVTAITEALEER